MCLDFDEGDSLLQPSDNRLRPARNPDLRCMPSIVLSNQPQVPSDFFFLISGRFDRVFGLRSLLIAVADATVKRDQPQAPSDFLFLICGVVAPSQCNHHRQ